MKKRRGTSSKSRRSLWMDLNSSASAEEAIKSRLNSLGWPLLAVARR
jgi:hypothetical protein